MIDLTRSHKTFIQDNRPAQFGGQFREVSVKVRFKRLLNRKIVRFQLRQIIKRSPVVIPQIIGIKPDAIRLIGFLAEYSTFFLIFIEIARQFDFEVVKSNLDVLFEYLAECFRAAVSEHCRVSELAI